MFLRSTQQASLLNLISKYQTATAAEATTAFQTWCLANPSLLTELVKEALIESGVGRSDTGNGSVSTFFALVESGIGATETFTGATLSASDSAALKVVLETAGNVDTAAHAITALQTWAAPGTAPAGVETLQLNQILYQGILATGAYGLTGGVVPAAVKTFVDKACTGFAATTTLGA